MSLTREPGDSHQRRQQFVGLNLIRGIAAFAVLLYHTDFMFGLRDRLLPSGYLAVDLFFILSGFVISYNYEDAIKNRALGFRGLAVRRLARLYPLYLVTFLIGVFVMSARFRSHTGFYEIRPLVISFTANILVLPSFSVPDHNPALFPFNGASWSIFQELVINAVFFLVLARLGDRLLAVAWLISAAGLSLVAQIAGSLDIGWGASNFWGGFPRTACSFMTGMLIWRLYKANPWQLPGWFVHALLALFIVFTQVQLVFPVSRAWNDMIIVTMFLPALVAVGVGANFGQLVARVANFLGDISYAVYLIQDFAIIAAAGATQYLLVSKISTLTPAAGLIFIPICLALSYVSYRYFEKPVRQWICGPKATNISSTLPDAIDHPRALTKIVERSGNIAEER